MQKRPQTGLEQTIDGIVTNLVSADPQVRSEAERELAGLWPDAIEPMLANLAKTRTRRRRAPLYLAASGLIFFLACHVFRTIEAWIGIGPTHLEAYLFWGVVPVALLLVAMTRWEHNGMTRALAAFDDVRTVGALAEAMNYGDRATRETAGYALCFLLPRMKAGDASLLNAKQRDCLNHILDGKDANLMIAVLKAYEQVGDSRALPSVRKLAAGQSALFRNGVVQEAACACLPFLEARAEQEKVGRSLLRPSSVGAVPSDALLRPTETTVENDPQQLLRAGQSEEGM